MSSGGIERDDDIKLVNSTVLFYQTLNMYFPDGTKFNSQLFLKVFSQNLFIYLERRPK